MPAVGRCVMKLRGVGSSTCNNIDRPFNRNLVRTSYKTMRRAGVDRFSARCVVADLLYVGVRAGIGFAIQGTPKGGAS